MITEEILMDDNPEVREYLFPVSFAAILALIGIAFVLVWWPEWRVFWSAGLIAVAVVVVTAAMDHRRREHARIDAEDARNEAFREALKRNPVGAILQPDGAQYARITHISVTSTTPEDAA